MFDLIISRNWNCPEILEILKGSEGIMVTKPHLIYLFLENFFFVLHNINQLFGFKTKNIYVYIFIV